MRWRGSGCCLKGIEYSFWSDGNVLTLIVSMGAQAVKILKNITLYTWNGWIIWFIDSASVKLFFESRR